MKYCESIFNTKRWKTREVLVGNVGVGGHNPIRIQSMTTSNTRDPVATADQAMRLVDAGCEIVRVTVQGMKEADACEELKNILIRKGYTTPIVADIHFYPPAAMRVVDFVDKVRINPGNFVDKRASFKTIEYDDESYLKEIEKIEEKFTPLVEKCKRLKRAMRIGTNHGSLSDRIMNRYGDTANGMVESAIEFTRICRQHDYHDIIFSMKASNPLVMIHAYRLLVAEMIRLDWDYPLHLGVTEAGEGEDGRVKSAIGIGSLLLDGLGDTIRVSLTEDPWHEIDPCKRLVSLAKSYESYDYIESFEEKHRDFNSLTKRQVSLPRGVGMHRDGTVILTVSDQQLASPTLFSQLGCDEQFGRPKIRPSSVDSIAIEAIPSTVDRQNAIDRLQDVGVGLFSSLNIGVRIVSHADLASEKRHVGHSSRFTVSNFNSSHTPLAVRISDEPSDFWSEILNAQPACILLAPTDDRLHYSRQFFDWLKEQGSTVPVLLNFSYDCSTEDLVIASAAECGALLADGLGDGVWLQGPYEIDFLRQLSFSILQAARMRTVKTDFISCPSCGRTLFDLQEVSRRIRERTGHLPGVKIAIMGCIVNGPGEMADADFGYVGSKPGKIDLYVGKTCVQKDISFDDADEALVKLIKDHGRWQEREEIFEAEQKSLL
jgi:(E)-4-hydroxy-3-methylbut-2-enyl-diphosphate synthase